MRLTALIAIRLTILLTLILGALIGAVRILKPPLALDRLRGCAAPCVWASIPIRDLAIGDIVAALGAPAGVLFSGMNGSSGRGYDETLIYPAQALTVIVVNTSLQQIIVPTTHGNLRFETLRSDPLYVLPWHGFTRLCRYVPDLIGVCAAP